MLLQSAPVSFADWNGVHSHATSVPRHCPPFAAVPPLRDANHLAGVCIIPVCDSNMDSVLHGLRETTTTHCS